MNHKRIQCRRKPARIGLIGFGSIGKSVASALAQQQNGPAISAVLLRSGRPANELPAGAVVCTDIDELLSRNVDYVVECAGQEAVRAFAPSILAHGVSLLAISTGAFAEASFYAQMQTLAETSGARLLISPGALGGIDALSAARIAGLSSVVHTVMKPPKAWAGSSAEAHFDIEKLDHAFMFYEGNARQAAMDFPQNANAAATVALAGIGLEKTVVRLIADPALERNMHRIEANGYFGSMTIEMRGESAKDNPKTSVLAALSLARAIVNIDAAIVV